VHRTAATLDAAQLNVAGFTLDGTGTATFGAIDLYHLLNRTGAADEGEAQASAGVAHA
jgi:hypothetical protein